MKQNFIPWHIDQPFLLPPDLKKWLPSNHLAFFVVDIVNQLDLSGIYKRYTGRCGKPPYDPRMMVSLLLYAYSTGVFSSRKIERHCIESVPFRVLAANQCPDHDTIANFRKVHLVALSELFSQVFQLARKAGLVKLGHISLDGTKIKANASKHKAMSYKRMKEEIDRLETEIADLIQKAEHTDTAESNWNAKDDYTIPDELARREDRLDRIRRAKEELEERFKSDSNDDDKPGEGGTRESTEKTIPDKTQINFTDSESRILPVNGGRHFEQGYNCQCVVDKEHQIVVDARVSQDTNDKKQLIPAIDALKNLGLLEEIGTLSADAGYCSSSNLTQLGERTKDCRLQAYIATGRKITKAVDGECADSEGLSEVEKMRKVLQSTMGQAVYSMRKYIVEPVFGQIKSAMGFDRFSFRGLENVKMEWRLVTTVHNLMKIYRS